MWGRMALPTETTVYKFLTLTNGQTRLGDWTLVQVHRFGERSLFFSRPETGILVAQVIPAESVAWAAMSLIP